MKFFIKEYIMGSPATQIPSLNFHEVSELRKKTVRAAETPNHKLRYEIVFNLLTDLLSPIAQWFDKPLQDQEPFSKAFKVTICAQWDRYKTVRAMSLDVGSEFETLALSRDGSWFLYGPPHAPMIKEFKPSELAAMLHAKHRQRFEHSLDLNRCASPRKLQDSYILEIMQHNYLIKAVNKMVELVNGYLRESQSRLEKIQSHLNNVASFAEGLDPIVAGGRAVDIEYHYLGECSLKEGRRSGQKSTGSFLLKSAIGEDELKKVGEVVVFGPEYKMWNETWSHAMATPTLDSFLNQFWKLVKHTNPLVVPQESEMLRPPLTPEEVEFLEELMRSFYGR